jgi:hypothetical protein
MTTNNNLEVIRAIRIARAQAMKGNATNETLANERRSWEGR